MTAAIGIDPGMKRCGKCGEEKPWDAFGRDNRGRDGLRTQCKECTNAANKERYDRNPEAFNARRRARWAANSEQISAKRRAARAADPERYRERKRASYWRNREADVERSRQWKAANRERHREGAREWKEQHPDRVRYLARRRRLARYGLTPEMFDEMLEQQGGQCAMCGTTEHNGINWQIDHDHACCATGSCGDCLRGILCVDCNRLLGVIENTLLIERAVAYLARYSRVIPSLPGSMGGVA